MIELLDNIIDYAISKKATDVHLKANEYPTIRVNTNIELLDNTQKITKDMMIMIFSNFSQRNTIAQTFDKVGSVDCSYRNRAGYYRLNFYKSENGIALSLRILPRKIPNFEDLHLPNAIRECVNFHSGLVLLTGATSNGKSTTIASLLDLINKTQKKHIITIEDPIEYHYDKAMCLVSQREIGTDCSNFSEALRSALRQDPDIILVGEMRDKETVEIALTAAETGHLVFSTLHTSSTAATVERILSYFDPISQSLIASKLAEHCRAIITQQLLPSNKGGMVPACEVLLQVPSIQNLIREGKHHQIYSMLQISKNTGMCTLEESLSNLVKQGLIAREEGKARSNNKTAFDSYMNQAGVTGRR